jgi:hypothetical protein
MCTTKTKVAHGFNFTLCATCALLLQAALAYDEVAQGAGTPDANLNFPGMPTQHWKLCHVGGRGPDGERSHHTTA